MRVRFTIGMDNELVEQCDKLMKERGEFSRSSFIEEAVKTYISMVYSENTTDYLSNMMSRTFTAALYDSEDRVARIIFKLAVEVSKLANITAYCNDIDKESLRKLHKSCVEEVKRINGVVELETAVKVQGNDA